MKNTIQKLLREGLLGESPTQDMTFLGYHSSEYELSGLQPAGEISSYYADIVRVAFMESMPTDHPKYHGALESDDVDMMLEVFEEEGVGFTFVSRHPIEGSSFQGSKYKYGDRLYKVYGYGDEIIIDDHNELEAEVVITKTELYFEQID